VRLTEEDIEAFLRGRSLSESTRGYYGDILGAFARWLGGRRLTVEAAREWLEGRYRHVPSRNTAAQVLRSFARWRRLGIPPVGEGNLLARWELERVEGMEGWKAPRALPGRKELPDGRIRGIFRGLEGDGEGSAAMFCLAYLGCRPRELTSLRERDVRRDRAVIVTEKTKVPREIPLTPLARERLLEFARSGRGYPYLHTLCGRYGITPRIWRSTFITRMQRRLAGAGLDTVRVDLLVKYLAGHTVRDITSVYTDYWEDARRAMLEHHYLRGIFPEWWRRGEDAEGSL
jgi:integrase